MLYNDPLSLTQQCGITLSRFVCYSSAVRVLPVAVTSAPPNDEGEN